MKKMICKVFILNTSGKLMEIEISRGCSTSLALELSTEKCIHRVEGFEFCINVATNVETEKKKW